MTGMGRPKAGVSFPHDEIPHPLDATILADFIGGKRSGHRSFPSLDAEVNIGWLKERERDLIVTALRAFAKPRRRWWQS